MSVCENPGGIEHLPLMSVMRLCCDDDVTLQYLASLEVEG